ncbi:peptidase M48 Ste24p [filamentous cyanobacterium CCP5]|nr:peptidase M48 Ste24p [filamentous cyanobacterium CCP5]
MSLWRRLALLIVVGFLGALLLGQNGLAVLGQAVWAQASADPLDTVEVSQPDDTLPLPYPDSPDGTLRLPEIGPLETDQDEAEPIEADTSDGSGTSNSVEVAQWNILFKGLSPDETERAKVLMAADQLYQAGDLLGAERLYRQAKDASWNAEASLPAQPEPISELANLPSAAAVFWREAQAGIEAGLETRIIVPLKLLVEKYPEFLPGQALYVDYLLKYDRADEAIAVIDAAIAQYPYHPILLKAQTQVLMAQEKWLEAAIAARQFTLFNPDHPETEAMLALSDENVQRFRSQMNQQLTGNLLSNIVTGAAGYILTGGLVGPFTAINSTMVLLQGETGIGQQVANQALAQLPIMEDKIVDDYVNAIGTKLAALTGRDEFDYEFHVVMDDSLNAFALPGGKIFLNAGALTKTHSEAELAGLIGHELAHAVLSHGFQMVTEGNLTNSLAAFIPIREVAGIAASLAVSGYSRDMERQADVLGTQILSASNYAADGLHNLMVTLKEEVDTDSGIRWFASHPAPDERIGYLKHLVEQGGFTRYTYEGVEPHLTIRLRVNQLMATYQAEEDRQNSLRRP